MCALVTNLIALCILSLVRSDNQRHYINVCKLWRIDLRVSTIHWLKNAVDRHCASTNNSAISWFISAFMVYLCTSLVRSLIKTSNKNQSGAEKFSFDIVMMWHVQAHTRAITVIINKFKWYIFSRIHVYSNKRWLQNYTALVRSIGALARSNTLALAGSIRHSNKTIFAERFSLLPLNHLAVLKVSGY